MTPILTVAIPTFNRNAILRANLALLLPQLTPDCRLLILDNHSPEPVADTVRDLLAAHPQVEATVVRHRANIGGNANVMRCFELCETEWAWVLGDDDTPRDGAVASALAAIREHAAALAINFSSNLHARPAGYTTRGADGFVGGVDMFNNVLFVSSNVYRVARLRAELNLGYHAAYTYCPHLVLLLRSVGEDGLAVFSTARLVDGCVKPADADRFSYIQFALAVMLVQDFELPALSPAGRRTLAERVYKGLPSWHVIVMAVVAKYNRGMIDRQRASYLISQYCHRHLWFHRPYPVWAAKRLLARGAVRMPRTAAAVYGFLARVRGGRGGGDLVADIAAVPDSQRL